MIEFMIALVVISIGLLAIVLENLGEKIVGPLERITKSLEDLDEEEEENEK